MGGKRLELPGHFMLSISTRDYNSVYRLPVMDVEIIRGELQVEFKRLLRDVVRRQKKEAKNDKG